MVEGMFLSHKVARAAIKIRRFSCPLCQYMSVHASGYAVISVWELSWPGRVVTGATCPLPYTTLYGCEHLCLKLLVTVDSIQSFCLVPTTKAVQKCSVIRDH